jgi:hypothetical protein
MPTKLAALLGTGSTPVIGAAATAGVVVAAAVGVTALRDGDAPDVTNGAETAAVQTDGGADVVTGLAPRFDVVRVDGRGDAVIAGRAMATAAVTVLLDGQDVGAAEADSGGNFVAMFTIPPADTPRMLSLVAQLGDGAVIPGEDSVIIAPFELTEEPPLLVVEAQPGPDGEVTAPGVLLANADGVRVLQPSSAAPEAQTGLRLDAISYDLEGDVSLAGRGAAEAGVRVTLDDEPVEAGAVGPAGDWQIDLSDVAPGTYTLRLEQLAADGSVTEELVTPFLREDPARLAANAMLAEPGAEVITVQPDFTLWGIAQANFGDGVLYVQIFEENRDTIRNPDRIFPGQVFRLPNLPRPEG